MDLVSLFLDEQDLVLVVDLSLSETLIALLSHVVETMLEAHLFRIVELFELGKLLLRVLINLIDRCLKLLFLLLKLVF